MFLTAFADYSYHILLNRFTVDTHITHKDRDIIYTLYIYDFICNYIYCPYHTGWTVLCDKHLGRMMQC